MRFFDDPGKALQQMEDELLEEDWDEEDVDEDGEDFPVLTRRDSRPTNYAVDFDRTVYDDEETDDAYYAEDYIADRKSRKKQRNFFTDTLAVEKTDIFLAVNKFYAAKHWEIKADK